VTDYRRNIAEDKLSSWRCPGAAHQSNADSLVDKIFSGAARRRLRLAASAVAGINRRLEWHYDRWLLAHRFQYQFGRKLDLRAPRTFNEKVCYKRLYDRRPLLTMVADRVRVREYIAGRVGTDYLTRIYQICLSPLEIDYERLPSQFVVKASHGTGMIQIVRDKAALKIDEVTPQFQHWLGRNLYAEEREWCYRDIPPRLVIEELLLDERGMIPADWKFYVFSGKAAYVDVHFGRYSNDQRNMYDRALNRVNVRWLYPNLPTDPAFPHNIEAMFEVAERLAVGFDFLRVDLYNIAGRIVVGELTNYPYGGMAPFDPPEFDQVLGAMWSVPRRYDGEAAPPIDWMHGARR